MNAAVLTVTITTDVLLRTIVDVQKNLGSVQLRIKVAAQAGQRTAEFAPNQP